MTAPVQWVRMWLFLQNEQLTIFSVEERVFVVCKHASLLSIITTAGCDDSTRSAFSGRVKLPAWEPYLSGVHIAYCIEPSLFQALTQIPLAGVSHAKVDFPNGVLKLELDLLSRFDLDRNGDWTTDVSWTFSAQPLTVDGYSSQFCSFTLH